MFQRRRLIFVLLVTLLLAGCASPKGTVAVCRDLSITLPPDCVDLCDAEYAADLDFLYACELGTFLGVREPRAELEQTYPKLTLEDYARLQIKAAGQSCTPEYKDGIYTYTYTALSGGESITYLSAVMETEDAFWAIQAYCRSRDFPGNREQLWSYLSTAWDKS